MTNEASNNVIHPTKHLLRAAIITALSATAMANHALAATSVDLILKNGKVATIDAQNSFATTVIVDDGRIVAVGDDGVASNYSAAKTLDLNGKTVLPGFVDNHVHPRPARPLPPGEVDLRYAYTWADNERILKQALKGRAAGTWVRASAFRLHFADDAPATPWINEDISKIPDRYALDKLAPNNPVIVRASQLVVANSQALRLAGITRDSKDPAAGDGHIEKDSNGEPTGILWYAVGDAIEDFAPPSPPIPKLSTEQEFAAYKDFFENLRSLGITSVNVAGARPPADFRVYQELHARYPGELPRMTIQPWIDAGYSMDVVRENLARLEGFGWRTGAGNEWVKLGAIKMGLDGGYTFSRPWPISEHAHKHVTTYYGGWRDLPDNFYQIFKRAHQLGWQIGVHTAGDKAAQIVTDVLERVIDDAPRQDHRHHLIHFEVGPPEETYVKMKKLGIGVSMQPNFTYALQPFFSLALEGDNLQRNNPGRSVLNHGLHLSYGSDERPYGPLIGLYAAVTRKGYDGKVYGADEAVTVQQAVRAYTIDSAWNQFDEKNRGSIEPGKLADFVVLSDDIFSIDPLRIKDIKILNTIIGGRVFEIPGSAKNRFYPDHP